MAIQEQIGPAPTISPAPSSGKGDRLLVSLYTLTAFCGAGLLFVVQPLIAKLLLPAYGGSATVWSTSSLFFQVLLLGAYWYVHWSTTRFGERWQPRLHLPLILLPALVLPIALPASAAPDGDVVPALWLLRTLVLMIGLPFAVVATTGPVLQKWFSWTGSRRAHDPYFLFAASNLGSFGGLLAYPLLIEPNLSLELQRLSWSIGFAIFAVLTALCALAAGAHRGATVSHRVTSPKRRRLTRRQVLYWSGLAFLPSTMMLGVTAHLSTDVAAIPLLWVVPLAIYLATFVLAFRRSSREHPVAATRAAVAVTFVAVITSLVHGAVPVVALVAVNLVMLALVAYAAHARLANDRPATDQLTSYYLVIAFGGALGGLLNGLLAPIVFDRVLEYPLALVVMPLLMVGAGATGSDWLGRQLRTNHVRAALVIVGIVLFALTLRLAVWTLAGHALIVVALVLVAASFGWFVSRHPVVVATAMVVLYAATAAQGTLDTIDQRRTFFGSYAVKEVAETHQLVHGTTIHGTQFMEAVDRDVPTTYYTPRGPLGEVFRKLDDGRFDRVAGVGLGTGTVAAYGRPGQTMTFFEIDPGIVEIARDPRLFTYIADSDATIETRVGDGRLKVAEYPEGSFDLLILDAFSSDSIPIHLLTEEAMEIYADRLDEDGLLMVHISNRVFDLEPVVANAADHLGWRAAIGHESGTGRGASASAWVALSPDANAIDRLLSRPIWSELGSEQTRWTDDYSSILSVLR